MEYCRSSVLCLFSGNKKHLKQGVSYGLTNIKSFGLLNAILWELQWLDKLFSHIVAVEVLEKLAVHRDLCWCGGQSSDVCVSDTCSSNQN